ncbi:MAG: DUF2065 domain-containing protein [Methylophilus sp.]|nr:DUF2065 domain-containing protein [Methylophilus sp.]
MKTTFLMALGLMLVIEGLLPLLMPQAWRENFKRLISLKDGQLRFIGLISILGGFLLMFLGR